MPIKLECSCGRRLNLADQLLGKRIKCPDCAAVLRVTDSQGTIATLEKPMPRKKLAQAIDDDDHEAVAVAVEDDDQEAPPPPKKGDKPAAPSVLDKRSKFVVKQQAKMLSSKLAYDICDADSGEVLAQAKPKKAGTMAALMGMLLGKDNMKLTIEVRQQTDNALLFAMRRQGFLVKKIEALDAGGKVVCSYKGKKLSMSGGYHAYDKAGKHLAEIRGKLLSSDFKFMTPDGSTEMGTISKTWGGLAKSVLTGAGTWGVQIAPRYANDKVVRTMILGAAIAISALFAKAKAGKGGGGEDDGGGGGGGDE